MNKLTLLLALAVGGGLGPGTRAQSTSPSQSTAAQTGTAAQANAPAAQSAQPAGAEVPSSAVPCAPVPPPPPPPSPESLEAGVRALLNKQVADWNRGDVTAFMRGYWKSPQTEFVSADGVMRGWQTVLDRYRRTYPDRASMGHLDFSGVEITVLGTEAALALGHWRLKRLNDTPGGVFTLVFRKFPEGWRIINDHTSQSP